MNSFIDAILHDGNPMVDGESARLTLEVINGTILSAVRKKVVDFPIDPDEYDQLYRELCDGRTKIPHFRPALKTRFLSGTKRVGPGEIPTFSRAF